MKATLLVAAVAAISLPAGADTTYRFTYEGTSTHTPDCWENLSLCGPGLLPTTAFWTGEVLLTTQDGDGTFLALSAEADGNRLNFPSSVSLTVADGQAVSVDGTASFIADGVVRYTFSGMGIAWADPAHHHYGPTTGVGTLSYVAPISPVPEPETWATLALGLMGLRLWRRAR